MSEKKVVGRTVAIALGIICLILAVSLVGAVVNYTSIIRGKDNTIATKDSQIASLNSQTSSLQNQKNQLQKWLDGNKTAYINDQLQYQSTHIYTNDQYNRLTSQISNLQSQPSGNQTLIKSLNSQISSLNVQISNLQSQLSGNQTQIASLNSQIQLLTSQKNQLQTWLNGNATSLNVQISNLQSQLSGNQTQIASLNSKIINLNDTINLVKSMVWVNNQTFSQPESAYTGWTFSASYAGYILVNVYSSTTINTYVEVIYSSHGLNYDNKIAVGTQGIAIFPVLPSNVEVRVGNTNLSTSATETVKITYHY